jgi:hypothetical protein
MLFECRLEAHQFGIADGPHLGQFRQIHAKQAAQAAVLRQQPLRHIGDSRACRLTGTGSVDSMVLRVTAADV